MAHSRVVSLGQALGDELITNADIEREYGLTSNWIESRTGITQRYRISSEQSTSTLAIKAGQDALQKCTETPDLVIVATTTPDYKSPAVAPKVASALGLTDVPAYDTNAVCSGFIYALAQANAMIKAEQSQTALVIGADAFSTIISPTDGMNRAIFGDGAGAAVVTSTSDEPTRGIISVFLASDGDNEDMIWAPGGGSANDKDNPYFQMQGRAVFERAVNSMSRACNKAMEKAKWESRDVDHIVAHQANKRILRQVANSLNIEAAKAVVHLDRVGNTSAASIPLALAASEHRIKENDRLLLTSFGGGLTWGAIAMTW